MADESNKLLQDVKAINEAVTAGGQSLLNLSEARNNGNTLATNNTVLKDRQELTPFEFIQKYGNRVQDILNQADQGSVALGDYMKANRSTEQAVKDTALDVISGANASLGNVGVLGAAILSPKLGLEASKLLSDFTDYTRGGQSINLKRNERITAVRAQLDEQDNNTQYEADVKKDGGFVAGLKYFGRDVLGGFSRTLENPAILGSTVAQGVGSLVSAGPVAKGLGLLGAGTKAALPTAVGLMEGGGAYSGTAQDIMGRSHEDLMQTSPEYGDMISSGMTPEGAKERIAHNGGIVAASIQGPTAALLTKATGVAGFESAPLVRRPAQEAVTNVLKEGVEEGLQGATGQASQNIGTKFQADPSQSVIQGTGSQAAVGVIGGVGSSIAIAAPGLVIPNALKAAGLTLDHTIGAGYRYLTKRGEDDIASDNAESSVSPEKLSPVIELATEQASATAESLRVVANEQGAKGPEVESYIAKIEQAAQVTAEDLSGVSETLMGKLGAFKEETGKVPNRFDTLIMAAVVAIDEDQSKDERVAAATFILKLTENNRKLFKEDLPEFIKNASQDTPQFKEFQGYASALEKIRNVREISQSLKWAREEMRMSDQDLTGVDINSDKGTRIVNQAVDVATVAPHALSTQVAEQILLHADNGTLALSPERRRILRGAIALGEAGRLYAAQNRLIEPGVLTEQGDQLQAELDATREKDEASEFVGKQIATEGGKGDGQLSLTQHVAGINHAASQGDRALARRLAQHLTSFAKSHINKVGAMNQSIKNGDGKNVAYSAFSPAKGKFYSSEKGFGVNVGSAGSERTARKIHAEAMAIASLSNSFKEQYPDFGLPNVKVPKLLLDNTQDNQTNIKSDNASNNQDNKKGSSAPIESNVSSQATTSGTDTKIQQEELPLSPSQLTKEPVNETLARVDVAESTGKAEIQSSEQVKADTKPVAKTPKVTKVVKDLADLGSLIDARTEKTTQETTPAEPLSVIEILDQMSEEGDTTLSTAEAFPTLVQVNNKNWFHKAFKLSKDLKSRMLGLNEPLSDFYRLFGSSTKLVAFMNGKKINYDVTSKEAEGFKKLLELGAKTKAHVDQRLQDKLGKGDLLKRIEDGEELIRSRDLRVLNLMEKTDTGYVYNRELMESAIIASLDWLINASNRTAPLSVTDVAALMGVDEDTAYAHLEDFNHGMTLSSAKQSLAQNIRKFWGVEANKDTRDAFVEGIPEAVAAEILHGMDIGEGQSGLLELGIKKKSIDKRLSFPGVTEKKFNRVLVDTQNDDVKNLIKSLNGAHDLLADLALIDRKVEGYSIGTAITEVDETQLRNPMVKLSNMAKRALSNAQKTPYFPNDVVFDFYEAMGEEAYVTLMSKSPYKEGDLKKTHTQMGYNKNHWKSIQGRQRGLVADYQNIIKQMASVRKHGTNVPTFYAHHINKLGRTQMDGASNPQTSKTAREIFMPTKSILDLSGNGKDLDKFLMTVGQGIGLKTDKMTRSEVMYSVMEKTMMEDGKFYPFIQEMKTWLEQRDNKNGKDLNGSLYQLLQDVGLSDHGMHSLLAVARYELARDNGTDLSAFETFNYLEADGKTNGPINALMLFASGVITPEWLTAVAKGGAFFGRIGKTVNSHEDKVDLYKDSSIATQVLLSDLGREIAQSNPEAHAHFVKFKRFLAALNVTDIEIKDGEISIDRGLVKNPLTITIYGSGPKGIAGNISNELISTIYEKLSESIKTGTSTGELIYGVGETEAFMNDLSSLTSQSVRKNNKTGGYFVSGSNSQISGTMEDFTLTKEQFGTLQDNVLTFLVGPLRNAIDAKVTGHVKDVTSTIQAATQIQSIILKGLFIDEVTKQIALMQSDPEGYDYVDGEFLSYNQLTDIRNKLLKFSPLIDTGTQSYMMSGGENTELFGKTTHDINGKLIDVVMPKGFSGSLSGDMLTPAHVYGPTKVGVKATPTMVIGSGDGQMIMNMLADNPEAAQRVLHVFDGVNLPADMIDEYSTMVNESVFKTWTGDGNPVRAVYESFAAFMGNDPVGTLFPLEGLIDAHRAQAKLELSQTKLGRLDVANAEILPVTVARAFMEDTLAELKRHADETDIRRQVYAEFDFSVDQMASAESPFVNKGKFVLAENATMSEIASAMQTRYEELRVEKGLNAPIIQEAEIVPEPTKQDKVSNHTLRDHINSKGLFDDETGVTVMHDRQLDGLIDALPKKTTDTQKAVLKSTLESLRNSGYTLVFGSSGNLDAFEQEYNADRFVRGSNNHHGKIDLVAKMILISNISVETLTHEVIHAATLDKVHAAYTNPKALGNESLAAVKRIEGLMDEWLAQDVSSESESIQDAYNSSKLTIGGLNKDPSRKVAAVNEFMAWVLSNQHLNTLAAETDVISSLNRIIGKALEAVKSLIFGKTASPDVGTDMLSNLRFNTQVLIAQKSKVKNLQQDFSETVLHHSATFGTDYRLSELRQKFNNRIVSWMKDNYSGSSNPVVQKAKADIRKAELFQTDLAAKDVTKSFAQHFPGLGTMQGWSTFLMVQTALMTNMELNANSLSRMEDIYEHVIDKLKVSDFRENKNPHDQNDQTQANERLNALQGLYVSKTDKQGRSSLLSSFLALAMTDDGFREILSKMEKPKSDKNPEKSLDATLENLANSELDRLSILLSGEKSSDANVQIALDRLTLAMIDNVGDQRSHIEKRSESFIDNAENATAKKIQDVSGKLAEKSANIARTSKSLPVKAAATVVNVFATLLNEEKSDDAKLGMVSWLNKHNKFNTIRDTVGNVIGRMDGNELIFDMISKVRAAVAQVRQNFRDELPVKLAREFAKPPTKAQWTAMFKSLAKTDLASITKSFGLDSALDLITNTRKLNLEIKALEVSINRMDPRRSVRLLEKAKQLGHHMITGEQGHNLMTNAEAIARLLSERGMRDNNPSTQLVEEIDRLVTLYSIQGLDQGTRDQITELTHNEKDRAGLEFAISYLMGQRVDELAKIGTNMVAKLNHYKGHIPSEAQQGGSLIIASETETGHLLGRGYKKLSSYKGSSAEFVSDPRAYFFAPVSGTAPFSQGVMQTVHQTVSGIDPQTGFTVDEVMAGRITNPNDVSRIERQLQRGNLPSTSENLLPRYDENGNVVAFERTADVSKLTGLNRSTDLAQMLGAWRGRQVEEILAQESNMELVDNLHSIWQKAVKDGKQGEFVNIAKLGSNKDDRILIEAANLIPRQAREHIKNVFGPDEFWVRRDMLLDTLGERQASVGDLFSGKTRWNPKAAHEFEKLARGIFGKNAYVGLVGAEKNVQELVANAKNMIVVKSVIVPGANLVSNMLQLLNRGVPLRHILKGFLTKTSEINSYIKRRAREVDLEADLRSATARNNLPEMSKLENQIRAIQDSYRRMSIWPLIDAGEFSAISNGQVTAEDLAIADGKWTDWVERKMRDLPRGLQTVSRYGLVTRDTALFQGLARAVQYGDFVGKAILYDNEINQKKATHQDAVATVNEAFVNYNRLAGRGRQYLESVGLLWFWNYKLRIIKEAVWTLRHNPLRSLLTAGVPIGSPIGDNFISVLLQGRLGWSVGPGMAWNSLSLNPWMQAIR